MGMIQHTALLVTSYDQKRLRRVHNKALSLFGGDSVSEPTGTEMNGYMTFMVAPSGSKLGWGPDEEHVENLQKLTEYIDAMAFDDGSNCVQFVKVAYGEFGTDIVDSNCKDEYREEENGTVAKS